MALQITSGVSSSAPLNSVTATTSQVAASTSSTVPPSYQLDFGGLTRSTAAGLSTPTSAGDIEVLFAEIAAALNDTIGVLTDEQRITRAETLRGQLGLALSAFSQMADWGDRVDFHRSNITVQQDIKDTQTKIRDDKTTEKDGLQTTRNNKQETLNTNEDNIDSYNEKIGILTGEKTALETEQSAKLTERSKLDPDKDAAAIATINQRLGEIATEISQKEEKIDYWQDLIDPLEAENVTLREDLETLDTQIDGLKKEISAAQDKIDEASSSQNKSRQTVKDTLEAMENFVEATLLMNVFAGGIRSDMGREAGQVSIEGQTFDDLVAGLARAMVDIGATLAQVGRDMDVALHTEGAGLNERQSVPDRFGQLSAPVARAIAFAGMIAGVLGPVRDLLTNLVEGLAMQTAESFALANAQRVRVGV